MPSNIIAEMTQMDPISMEDLIAMMQNGKKEDTAKISL